MTAAPAEQTPAQLEEGSEAGQAVTPLPGFTAAHAEPYVSVKLGFPNLWPDTVAKPIHFKLEYLLSGDADREQGNFLKLTEVERAAETYRYDCRMISLLSCEPPEGLLDFPATPEPFDPDNEQHRKELAAAVFAYLYRPGERSARAFAFLGRQVMSRYWSRVLPRDYL
jgi:hypothetical protein